MAKTGDWDTVAAAVGYLAEMGRPDVAAELVRRLMSQAEGKPEAAPAPRYATAAHVLRRMVGG